MGVMSRGVLPIMVKNWMMVFSLRGVGCGQSREGSIQTAAVRVTHHHRHHYQHHDITIIIIVI
jgi:hypothetical protein